MKHIFMNKLFNMLILFLEINKTFILLLKAVSAIFLTFSLSYIICLKVTKS